jgi:hypothetical protein
MSPLAYVATLALAPMLAMALWNAATAPRLHRYRPRTVGPRVSILVPARDEAANLRALLPALLRTRYPLFEVVVLDDGSRDETLAVAREFTASDERVRWVEGLDLPGGWTGKNWACHQLSRHARGEVLVFCDADVRPGEDAVGRTVAAFDAAGADVLTAIPRDVSVGWLPRSVVPLLASVPVAALLPLSLVPTTRSPGLSMGNGQWFAWRRDAYHRAGGHRAVRGDPLEDVRLARLAKAIGLRLLVAAAPRDLAVGMYTTAAAAWEGFGKNVFLLLGGRAATAAGGTAVFGVAMLLPLLLPFLPGTTPLDLVPLGLLLALRLVAGKLFGEGAFRFILHPAGAAFALALSVASWRKHRAGHVLWKGRRLRPADAL